MRQDEDIERRKRFPWKSSFRRPASGPSSVILVALLAGVYLIALASIAPLMLGAPSTFNAAALIPFR